MSIGGTESCSVAMQNAVNAALAANISLIVAAGNESSNVSTSSPANCVGVISVAAAGPSGQLAAYSNFGKVTITAAGGDFMVESSIGGVLSTIFNSESSYSDCIGESCFDYGWKSGTSMATPHVTAAVAAMLAQNTYLTPAQQAAKMQKTGSPLQNSCSIYESCVAPVSGATVAVRLNATAAVQRAQQQAPVSSGGCSMLEGGDDYGLILLLMGASGIYLIRRRRKQAK